MFYVLHWNLITFLILVLWLWPVDHGTIVACAWLYTERKWQALIPYNLTLHHAHCVSICKFVLMCWLQAGSVKLGADRPNFLPISAPAVPAPSPNSGTKPFYRPSNRPFLYIYNVHRRRASHFTTNYESWHISYMYSVTKSYISI